MKKIFKHLWLVLVLTAPIILWLMPANFFDEQGIITCPSILLFSIECIGCGMTRAIMHFHHFQFSEAIFYNYGVVVMYPLLVFFWFFWLRIALKFYGIYPKQG